MNTCHPLIYKSLEKKIDSEFLENIIDQMIISLKNKELAKSLNLAKKIVPEWKSN